jgi:O-antigen/teichoic acid export membrane protein
MTAQTRSGPIAALRGVWQRSHDLLHGVWQRNHDLLRNAGSMVATTSLTSVFGFVYWIVAAREFSQQAVGYGAAAVSAMTLVGTIGMFGLGTMLIGELPKRRERGGLVAATLVASGLGSLVLGLGFPLVVGAFGSHFPEISGTPGRLALFAVGVALTGATMVLDEATIGLMRGGVQLSRNLAASVIKLVALPVAAIVLHDGFGVGLILAWVIGTLLSLVPTVILLRRGGSRIFHRPDWGLLRKLRKVAMAHNWLNLAIATPPKLIPVLVTVVVSPSANAVFYVAWMMVSFLLMVPASLSTVLFAIASAAPELIGEKLRFVLRLSVLIGLPAMVVLALGSHLALGLFGASYVDLGTVPLLLLILTYIPGLPKTQYIAVCRATGRVSQAAVLLTVAAGCELGAVVIGGRLGGLNGVALAYLAVTVVEGIVTAPTVLRTAYARGYRRRATTGDVAALPATAVAAGQDIAETSYLLEQQQTSVAGLIALASAAIPEGHALDPAAQVSRTGSLPTVAPDDRPQRRAAAVPGQADQFGAEPAGSRQQPPVCKHGRSDCDDDGCNIEYPPASRE